MIICTLIYVTLSTTRRGRVGIGKLALQIAFALQHLFWCKAKIGHPVMRPQKTQIFSFFSSKRRKALQIWVVISNAFKQMWRMRHQEAQSCWGGGGAARRRTLTIKHFLKSVTDLGRDL